VKRKVLMAIKTIKIDTKVIKLLFPTVVIMITVILITIKNKYY